MADSKTASHADALACSHCKRTFTREGKTNLCVACSFASECDDCGAAPGDPCNEPDGFLLCASRVVDLIATGKIGPASVQGNEHDQ